MVKASGGSQQGIARSLRRLYHQPMETLNLNKKPRLFGLQKVHPSGLKVDVDAVDNSLMLRLRRARQPAAPSAPAGVWQRLAQLLGGARHR